MPENSPKILYSKRSLETRGRWSALDIGLVLLLMALGLGLRAWNVEKPAEMFFDEIYYVDAANDLMDGKTDPNSVHPPLAKWMIGWGMAASKTIWGLDVTPSLSWRFASVVAGVLMVGATYGLALLLFNYNRPAATIAGFIVATEHLHLSMTRIAMLDPFLALFCVLGTWASLAYFLGAHERWALVGAFSLGLATGCKWSGLFTAFGCFLACWWIERDKESRVKTTRYFFWLVLLLPLGFFLTYLHLFLMDGFSWSDFKTIFGQGERMVKFRADSERFNHGYLSQFWQWPLVLRPIWLFYEQDGKGVTAQVEGICSLGLPVLWWGYFVLMIERAVHSYRKHDLVAGALVLIWVGQWLPWCVSLTGGFFYYMLPQVPIMACLVGKFLADLANFEDRLAIGRWRFWALMGVYVASAALYYPFVTAMVTNRGYFNMLFFIPDWV